MVDAISRDAGMSGKRQAESGKWKAESGKRRKRSGKQGAGSVERQAENGKQQRQRHEVRMIDKDGQRDKESR